MCQIKYVLVLVPGFNGDGREWVYDREWQNFADEQQCAILACYFTIIEGQDEKGPHYNVVENWSGKALFDALRQFSIKTEKLELDTAVLLLWGHSAGGAFSYNMANWKPERVAAFVDGKSVYNTNDPAPNCFQVPGLFIAGEKDSERFDSIARRYSSGRRSGALWCYAIEPAVGHNIAKSPSLGRAFSRHSSPAATRWLLVLRMLHGWAT